MGQSSSHHVVPARGTHQLTRSIAPKHIRPYKHSNEDVDHTHDAPRPRQRAISHRPETQSIKPSSRNPETTYGNVPPARSRKEHSARHSNKSALQRKFPTSDRRYYHDELESNSTKRRKGSEVSVTELNRRTPRQKKRCVVCTDNRSISRFPSHPPTSHCAHDADVCRRCLRTWIDTTFADKVWDEINCPICSERLAYEDVREFGPREVFRRYKKLSTKAALEAIPGFHWCLTRGCKSGQVISPGSHKFYCIKCKKTYCLEHNMSWHKGETCKEYEYRTNKTLKKKEETASKKWLKEKAKACPGCKRPIEKADGCDHMTCSKCRHQFCWECLAPYKKPRDATSVAHRVDCVHHIARAVVDDSDEEFFYRP